MMQKSRDPREIPPMSSSVFERRRPAVAVLASAVSLVAAGASVFAALLLIGALNLDQAAGNEIHVSLWVVAAVQILAAPLYAVAAIFIFLGRRWARALGLAVAAASVAVNLINLSYYRGAIDCTSMVIPIAVLWLMLRPAIAEWCYR
jgi:hypothetical protein